MYRHNPQGLEFGTRYRIDSASGSSTPVTVYRTDATTNPIGTAFTGGSGSNVREHDPRGGDTVFYASQATLYLKPLDYLGVQLGGGAVITSTGVAPADPGNGQPNYSGAYGPTIGSDNWLKAWASNIDTLIRTTAITRDSNGAATSASVIWPDGTAGTYTGTASATVPGAVDSYTVTYVGATTKTVTQPTMTRDTASGAVTNRPALTVA